VKAGLARLERYLACWRLFTELYTAAAPSAHEERGKTVNNKLSCLDIVELVTDYIDNALPAEERPRFEHHLTYFPGCVTYVDQIRETIRVTRRLPREEPTARRCARRSCRSFLEAGPARELGATGQTVETMTSRRLDRLPGVAGTSQDALMTHATAPHAPRGADGQTARDSYSNPDRRTAVQSSPDQLRHLPYRSRTGARRRVATSDRAGASADASASPPRDPQS
jgi:hypothetical protein